MCLRIRPGSEYCTSILEHDGAMGSPFSSIFEILRVFLPMTSMSRLLSLEGSIERITFSATHGPQQEGNRRSAAVKREAIIEKNKKRFTFLGIFLI